MLTKWITCTVPDDSRAAFSTAQQQWSVISDQPGLLGQLGGWRSESGAAHIVGLWTSRDAYRSFMADRHDAVTEHNGQRDAYTELSAATGEVVLGMAGSAATITEGLAAASVLRVADCEVQPARAAHFLDVQRRIWAPAMAASGMLGGVLTRLDQHRYLVTTWWSDHRTHQRYAEQDVARLRAESGADTDLSAMTGCAISLERAWRVVPGSS